MTPPESAPQADVWQVSALCQALGQTLQARFGLLRVRGEISGFVRASSGHCYFQIKDASAQLRCAMFRRAALGMNFAPKDGDQVELSARAAVYEARGELQLVVEGMRAVGVGNLYEQFLRLKARLQAEGLFDAQRKRAIPGLPRGIAVVTSPAAAAWQDVQSALQRRAPHVPVWLVASTVQGAEAPSQLRAALSFLYQRAQDGRALQGKRPVFDVILLVRGGGSLEDLWAFNDEALVRLMARSPVPIISGVGHETDFTLADFVADLRAPTPTAAAELAATDRQDLLYALRVWQRRCQEGVQRHLERHGQRLDRVHARLGRPSQRLHQQQQRLDRLRQRLQNAVQQAVRDRGQDLARRSAGLTQSQLLGWNARVQRLENAATRLRLLDPHQVLTRGYAWLHDAASGAAVTRAAQTHPGQTLQLTLADGGVAVRVQGAD